jgi:hypothetical protein
MLLARDERKHACDKYQLRKEQNLLKNTITTPPHPHIDL